MQKEERRAKESLTGAFFQQSLDGPAFSEGKGSSGHGGFSLPSGVFLCLGKQNAGMQESPGISARCNAEREPWDVPTHTHILQEHEGGE